MPMGVIMIFKYKWSDKENGNYAIRRKDAKSKPAGKEIEPKNKTQTSDTHFFILINEEDQESMYNRIMINKMLKTVKFEYVCKGTEKNPLTRYLTKKDIEKVLSNIEKYENGTIKIEMRYSNELETEKGNTKKILKMYSTGLEKLLNIRYSEIINMLKTNVSKEQGLKEKKRETEIRIKKINAELKSIKNGLLEYETTVNTETEEIEKRVFNIMKRKMNDLQYARGDNVLNFQNLLEYVLYPLAKKDMKRESGNLIQKRYRKKKNIESGKPAGKRGRPPKNKE